ncbi:SGNH/GDSL hydrolase family protein [Nocardioides sp. HDW12B]|uniref:SGNH/GDSL hydrolase family protein n=1 Tax=Nocardioides sp. HDW12B TaxID=2714939 RepID=UPI00140D6EC9|nr:SGNH/GDSL hydrolase family protein [Nocardioides sp. HDW12B]QIK65192.1 SGNH/GDSL hydrolase family protein [Nocardioides sp. HDW12B]
MAPADPRGRRAPRRLTSAALSALLLATLTGCWSSGAEQPSEPSSSSGTEPSTSDGPQTPAFTSYAALGDSYTAAPFVPVTDLAEGCLRSNGNYPALLADALGIAEVRDVSCSAAETRDVEVPQRVAGGQGTVPPQLRAVRRGTDLVTLGIGGNDEDLFATLVGCVGGFGPAAPGAAPPSTGPCLGDVADPTAAIGRVGERVALALDAVTAAAPRATVVLVGYPRLVGEAGGCRQFPIDPSDVPAAQELEKALRDALAGAARRAGVTFLDTYTLSAGHEICADDPWVNGRRTDESRALAFHPFAEGQQAVADALAARLGQEAS